MKKVELYARVRHAVRIEGISERVAAARFGINPRIVSKMLRFSVPPGYVRARPPIRQVEKIARQQKPHHLTAAIAQHPRKAHHAVRDVEQGHRRFTLAQKLVTRLKARRPRRLFERLDLSSFKRVAHRERSNIALAAGQHVTTHVNRIDRCQIRIIRRCGGPFLLFRQHTAFYHGPSRHPKRGVKPAS